MKTMTALLLALVTGAAMAVGPVVPAARADGLPSGIGQTDPMAPYRTFQKQRLEAQRQRMQDQNAVTSQNFEELERERQRSLELRMNPPRDAKGRPIFPPIFD